jgi:hypothetical protein
LAQLAQWLAPKTSASMASVMLSPIVAIFLGFLVVSPADADVAVKNTQTKKTRGRMINHFPFMFTSFQNFLEVSEKE